MLYLNNIDWFFAWVYIVIGVVSVYLFAFLIGNMIDNSKFEAACIANGGVSITNPQTPDRICVKSEYAIEVK